MDQQIAVQTKEHTSIGLRACQGLLLGLYVSLVAGYLTLGAVMLRPVINTTSQDEGGLTLGLPGTISNYIWNSSAVPPGGTTPQSASLNITGSITGSYGTYSRLFVGNNVIVANRPGYANTVGIGTQTPNTLYKLDVAGKLNTQELCINGDCRSSWPTEDGGSPLYYKPPHSISPLSNE
jgi:hypothetical protein